MRQTRPLLSMCLPCYDADWKPPPYSALPQPSLKALLDADTQTIDYYDYMEAQLAQQRFACYGGATRDYGLASNRELATLDFCINNCARLIRRVPHCTAGFELSPAQRLLIGFMAEGKIDTDVHVSIRDLTKPLDAKHAHYRDSFRAEVKAGHAMRLHTLVLPTGLGKSMCAILAHMVYLCDPVNLAFELDHFRENAAKDMYTGSLGCSEGALPRHFAPVVIVTVPPHLKAQWLEYAVACQAAMSAHDPTGVGFEVWSGFTSTHAGLLDASGKRPKPSLRAAVDCCPRQPILWILPGESEALRRAHYELGGAEIRYYGRINDDLASADRSARTGGSALRHDGEAWRCPPRAYMEITATPDSLQGMTKGQPLHIWCAALNGPNEDAGTGFSMTSPRHLCAWFLGSTPWWLAELVARAARPNMPRAIRFERVYLKITSITAQRRGASALATPGIREWLFAVLESFRESGEQHLSREQLLPYVQRLEDAILKAFTSEELAQMVDESDAEAGKSLRLLAAQLQTEQDIADRKAEQRRVQLEEWRANNPDQPPGQEPPELPPTTEMQLMERYVRTLKHIRPMVGGHIDGEDDGAPVMLLDGLTGNQIAPTRFACYMPCCERYRDIRGIAHDATECQMCHAELDPVVVQDVEGLMATIENAPRERAGAGGPRWRRCRRRRRGGRGARPPDSLHAPAGRARVGSATSSGCGAASPSCARSTSRAPLTTSARRSTCSSSTSRTPRSCWPTTSASRRAACTRRANKCSIASTRGWPSSSSCASRRSSGPRACASGASWRPSSSSRLRPTSRWCSSSISTTPARRRSSASTCR